MRDQPNKKTVVLEELNIALLRKEFVTVELFDE